MEKLLLTAPEENNRKPEDRFHRKIQAGTKYRTVLDVLKKRIPVKQAAQREGVTREIIWEWTRKFQKGAEKALESNRRGRKEKDYVKDRELRKALAKTRHKLEKTAKENNRLLAVISEMNRQKEMLAHAYSFFKKEGLDPKKNGKMERVLEKYFCSAPGGQERKG